LNHFEESSLCFNELQNSATGKALLRPPGAPGSTKERKAGLKKLLTNRNKSPSKRSTKERRSRRMGMQPRSPTRKSSQRGRSVLQVKEHTGGRKGTSKEEHKHGTYVKKKGNEDPE